VKNRPPYAIASVDHALHLVALLQQEGSLSVSEGAELLGVARSTAHRLLTTLVYRDVAEQGADRRYRPGTALGTAHPAPALLLRRAALPHMQALVERVEETVSLQIRVGTEVRFVESVECTRALRVGDRSGKVLPAHQVAGGKVLLAALPPTGLSELYDGGDLDTSTLRKRLALVRTRGYAVNDQETEAGVTAVGVLVPGSGPEPAGALSLAVPSTRFARADLASYVGPLHASAARIAADLR